MISVWVLSLPQPLSSPGAVQTSDRVGLQVQKTAAPTAKRGLCVEGARRGEVGDSLAAQLAVGNGEAAAQRVGGAGR